MSLCFFAVSSVIAVLATHTKTTFIFFNQTKSDTAGAGETDYDIYDILKVVPPSPCLFPRLKRLSWKLHGRLLPFLHFRQGKSCPPDVFVNLRVLWNKALTSLDLRSPANESEFGYPTYHLLPKISRWILFKATPIKLYPRWMHANIELRTVYLDMCMEREISEVLGRGEVAGIEVVILGGGYDTRSIKTLLRYPDVERVYELDLPQVVQSKEMLMKRMYEQLPEVASTQTSLQFLPVDLNDLDQVQAILHKISQVQLKGTHTIVVSEAVLLYLKDEIPMKLLNLCREIFRVNISWLLVDNLKEITKENGETLAESRRNAEDYMGKHGWQVIEWLIKPGATQHMGIIHPA